MKRYIIKLLLLCVLSLGLFQNMNAQKTAAYDNIELNYQSALGLFQKGLYGAAQNKFLWVIQQVPKQDNEVRIAAEYYRAICAVELFNNDAESLLRQFIEDHPQSSYLRNIYFQLGKFQYRKNNFRNVIKSFEKVDVTELNKSEQAEFYFKRGYAYLKRKKFESAKKSFYEIIERENKYKSLALYYYSHIAYLDHNYETALKGFLKLKDDAYLKPIIPYYVTHIYFMQQKYEELLKIAPSLLEKSSPQRADEINKLIGEAYYNTGHFKEAIPYLNQYHKKSKNTVYSQYELGYAHYQSGDYDQAISYLKHVGTGTDSLAQNANYHLGMSYIKTHQLNYALNAFKYAASSQANKNITEDALYNYAKLAYETSFNPYNNAIDAFQKYLKNYPQSPRQGEVMEYLTKMYLSTKNYQQAKTSIEKIQNKSPEMMAAYQRIIFALGVEHFNSRDFAKSQEYFKMTQKYNFNPKLRPASIYWNAEANYRLEKYPQAIEGYKKFLTTPGAFQLDYYNRAYYNIGYAYFKLKDYDQANINFRIYERKIQDSTSAISNDVYLRLGDCYFMKSQLNTSISYYNKTIALNGANADYAYFKKAEAQGAMGQWNEKAQSFESLIQKYPNSTFVGNAELALAKTYFNALSNIDKAIEHYEHIINNNPPQKSFVKKAMLDLGLVYSNNNQQEKAIEIWKKVNEYYKGTQESKDALNSMREVYVTLNKVDEFFEYIKTLGVKPSISMQDSTTYLASEAIYMDGDCDKSSQGFAEYISRFPAGAFTTNAYFYMADCEFRASQFDKALNDYTIITKRPVTDFSEKSWNRIAYIYYYKKDDFAKALEAYTNLAQIAEYAINIKTAKIGIMRSLWNIHDTAKVLSATDQVLAIENLDNNTKIEALLIKAKSAFALDLDSVGLATLNYIISITNSEAAAEARYLKAKRAFAQADYKLAESIVYDIIQQDPSYEYWVAKSLVLSADIFMKTDNEHQAIATLESIISSYNGDEELILEAKNKLAAIKYSKEKGVKSLEKDKDIIIQLNQNDIDNTIFEDIDNEEFIEEEEYEN